MQNDRWIKEQAAKGMIEPFEADLIQTMFYVPGRAARGHGQPWGHYQPCLSYGCSSHGYDLRLSPVEFYVFRHVPGTVMDPKDFNPANLERVELQREASDQFFILPAHSYGLGVALEKLRMPPNATGICLGKSTYARMGIILNTTPVEAGWSGHLTLEFSNSSGADCRIYANEGVCQLLFSIGDPCDVTYQDRSGKYQDQPEEVVMARV